MQLISVILLLLAIWVVYQMYKAYNNIAKELKDIKEKCIKTGVTEREAFTEHVSTTYASDKLKAIRNQVLSSLQAQLEKID